jgi:hypothetical protein
MPEYFDYISVAREAGISDADLKRIEAKTRADYGSDGMMFELRMLRTCSAIRAGVASVEDALRPDADSYSVPAA